MKGGLHGNERENPRIETKRKEKKVRTYRVYEMEKGSARA